MPQGLQVFDSNGDPVMDTTTSISTLVDRVYITASSGSFIVTNDIFVTNTPFVITNAQGAIDNSPMVFYENHTANTLTVSYSGALYSSSNPSYFVIGVY